MSTIPLPAFCAANPPQVQDPLAEIKNVLALRNIQQQGQTQQLNQQALSQENEQRGLDLKDQQTSRQAMIDSQGDPDAYLANLRKGGVSGKTYFAQSASNDGDEGGGVKAHGTAAYCCGPEQRLVDRAVRLASESST